MRKSLNFLGLIIGIIGVLLAVYFHFSSIKEKEISYNIQNEALKIYDSDLLKENQNIAVYQSDSIKIDKTVYINTFSIWNSGDLPISKNDIRKDLIINFLGVEEILDIQVLKEIDKEVSKFNLIPIDSASYKLNWDYFDPKDGLKFQIIYTGNSKVEPQIDTKILLTDIIEYKPTQSKKFQEKGMYSIFISGTGSIFLLLIVYNFFSKKPLNPLAILTNSKLLHYKPFRIGFMITKLLFLIMLMVYVSFFIYLLYLYYFGTTSAPF
ncbi:hypothetical protein [Christiangramia sabulilitoris]|uniref:Uncharacterized protein n=1 Tax=Christiangramia sabulilitoris TaxID=2583991 RepID=A0A550I752_9FLAO|nr:hypothetical protein [Christiangramia sabulilitoris]TRO66799.1 hypothetical protein FGM01_02595 [Christiangramia sabulilitoris]